MSEIVGHKTFSDGHGGFRHEPLTREEADEIWKRVEEAKAKRAADMPTEEDAARAMCEAHHRLKELGWREFCYAPVDRPLRLIEPGSSGIHEGTANGEWPRLSFCIFHEGDQWPSHPCLFKEPLPAAGSIKGEKK